MRLEIYNERRVKYTLYFREAEVLLPEVSAVAVDCQRLQAEICEEKVEEEKEEEKEEEVEKEDVEDMDKDEEVTKKDGIL
jgi:hypothetical protein